ncbi:VOC family protein [Streptomyces sp. NPDC048462]|uniref:VOC family protein n=1 Tax=Streptomyces sp. NPDC048462 TaxID=3365555 RepID=UPI0037112B0D
MTSQPSRLPPLPCLSCEGTPRRPGRFLVRSPRRSRLHLDFSPEDWDAEIERFLALGARPCGRRSVRGVRSAGPSRPRPRCRATPADLRPRP